MVFPPLKDLLSHFVAGISHMTDSREIDRIIAEVEEEVFAEGNSNDIAYFSYHKKRFRRMAHSFCREIPTNSKVLEIGSHHMHSSMILSKLGYKVTASDVEVFMSMDVVRQRSEKYAIQTVTENNLETLESQGPISNEYDALLFTEIFEHITFNPINFWKRVYEIMKEESCIYISTPNGLCFNEIFRSLANIFLLRGIGIGVGPILSNVTYGHHWKMYSSSEIKRYFKALSDDFSVKIKRYSYSTIDTSSASRALWTICEFIGNLTYYFATDLEAIVSIKKTGNWKIEAPEY